MAVCDKPQRVLVTGAGGLLGRALSAAALPAGWQLVGLPRGTLDIAEPAEVAASLDRERPDVVLNAAAYTNVDGAETDPAAAVRANALGPAVLAAETARRGLVLLHVSTDHVFAGDATRPYREDDPTGPRSVYGQSKLAGEEWVRRLQPRHYVVRTAGLFGPGGPSFVDAIWQRAARGEPLRVVGDQVCGRTYSVDLAAALLELTARRPAFGTYHVANLGAGSWYSFAVMICQAAGWPTEVTEVSSAAWRAAAWRPAWSVLDTGRWERAGLTRLRPVEEAVIEYRRQWG